MAKVGRRAKRVLAAAEISRLLDAATPLYQPILALAVYTGLRQSECLGLHWRDVDFDAGFVRVRGFVRVWAQLDRSGERVEPKTAEAIRNVVLVGMEPFMELSGPRTQAQDTRRGSRHWRRGTDHATPSVRFVSGGQRRLRSAGDAGADGASAGTRQADR